jgi:crotonobetainyl-CoA:carnitine CoA-transferase CaiB-like acyl-CoA transferase
MNLDEPSQDPSKDEHTDASSCEPTTGALDGVRVLDLSAVVSGPMAAVILADQGADVIKIEPPGWGDGVRSLGASRNGLSAIFSLINRNKRSLGINLKHPAGQQIVKDLAKSADVILQNYRPGKMARLGLDYESIKAINPNIIYASINGMGEIGPYAEQKVYDYVIQGLSGVLDSHSASQSSVKANELQMVRTIIYDKVTSLTAAQGITAALFARERGRGGQHIKLTMLDAAVYFNWPDLMWNHSFVGEGVQYSGDLADMYEISQASDGAIISHAMGADCSEYTTAELVDIFAKNEIPVAKANRRSEVADDPQVQALGILQDINHPRGGQMRQPRPPVQFGSTPSSLRAHSPDVGEHTVEILSELGLSMQEMQKLAQDGAIG